MLAESSNRIINIIFKRCFLCRLLDSILLLRALCDTLLSSSCWDSVHINVYAIRDAIPSDQVYNLLTQWAGPLTRTRAH